MSQHFPHAMRILVKSDSKEALPTGYVHREFFTQDSQVNLAMNLAGIEEEAAKKLLGGFLKNNPIFKSE